MVFACLKFFYFFYFFLCLSIFITIMVLFYFGCDSCENLSFFFFLIVLSFWVLGFVVQTSKWLNK